jgi:hypothetical protein
MLPSAATSSSGVTFNPRCDKWLIKDVARSAFFDFAALPAISADFARGMKKMLLWYVENRSIGYAHGIFEKIKRLLEHMATTSTAIISEIDSAPSGPVRYYYKRPFSPCENPGTQQPNLRYTGWIITHSRPDIGRTFPIWFCGVSGRRARLRPWPAFLRRVHPTQRAAATPASLYGCLRRLRRLSGLLSGALRTVYRA